MRYVTFCVYVKVFIIMESQKLSHLFRWTKLIFHRQEIQTKYSKCARACPICFINLIFLLLKYSMIGTLERKIFIADIFQKWVYHFSIYTKFVRAKVFFFFYFLFVFCVGYVLSKCIKYFQVEEKFGKLSLLIRTIWWFLELIH